MLVVELVCATPNPAAVAARVRPQVRAPRHARTALPQETSQELLQAWQDYQETGLHVTSDEAIAWLQTWGSDHEQSAPACHR